MDGMTEACMKGGIEACYSSVSCACALLGALDELSKGRGITTEQVRGEMWVLNFWLLVQQPTRGTGLQVQTFNFVSEYFS